jgi:hypothetical protein
MCVCFCRWMFGNRVAVTMPGQRYGICWPWRALTICSAHVQPFNLTKWEVVQLINHRPPSLAEAFLVSRLYWALLGAACCQLRDSAFTTASILHSLGSWCLLANCAVLSVSDLC